MDRFTGWGGKSPDQPLDVIRYKLGRLKGSIPFRVASVS